MLYSCGNTFENTLEGFYCSSLQLRESLHFPHLMPRQSLVRIQTSLSPNTIIAVIITVVIVAIVIIIYPIITKIITAIMNCTPIRLNFQFYIYTVIATRSTWTKMHLLSIVLSWGAVICVCLCLCLCLCLSLCLCFCLSLSFTLSSLQEADKNASIEWRSSNLSLPRAVQPVFNVLTHRNTSPRKFMEVRYLEWNWSNLLARSSHLLSGNLSNCSPAGEVIETTSKKSTTGTTSGVIVQLENIAVCLKLGEV